MNKKEITLANGDFNWILKVGGNTFTFNGSSFAQYLKEHYEELGYKVNIEDPYNILT